MARKNTGVASKTGIAVSDNGTVKLHLPVDMQSLPSGVYDINFTFIEG